MKFRILIINPMQSPPGVWLAKGKDPRGNRCVAYKREEAATFTSQVAAEIEAELFAKTCPKRGNEQLTFLYLASKD